MFEESLSKKTCAMPCHAWKASFATGMSLSMMLARSSLSLHAASGYIGWKRPQRQEQRPDSLRGEPEDLTVRLQRGREGCTAKR